MGIDYRQEILVGYRISKDNLESHYWTEVSPETYKIEERFCSKTEKRLEPVKVIDKTADLN
jgi:hypothetical protein